VAWAIGHGVLHPAAAHEAALLRLTRLAVDEQESLERTFQHATRLIAQTLNVERVGIWLFDDPPTVLRCACLYEQSTDSHTAGATLRRADVPQYAAALAEHRAIAADDARSDPLTRELLETYLLPLGITSMLDAPLLRHGEVVGVVCHEHVGPPRTWTERERRFAASVADIVALVMEQAAYIEAQRTVDRQAHQLEEEGRMAAVGRVAAAVGHDFNNLLTIVLSRVQQILGVLDLPPEAAEHAKVVLEAVRRSRELTRQLAELGRGAPGTVAPLVVDGVLDASRDLLRSLPQGGQRIEVDLAADQAAVRIDRVRLEQLLMNLVTNALQATGPGATVRVRTSVVDGTWLVLQVADEGTGIDDAVRARIFEPYFTTRSTGGCGLGLAIVHAIVQRTEGFIAVDTALGRGTTVTAHLPIATT